MVSPWRALLLPLLIMLGIVVHCRAATSLSTERAGGEGYATMTLRPDCPSSCGGVVVPYPFGLWENCSLPGFDLTCVNYNASAGGPQVRTTTETILSISLVTAQARVYISPSTICGSNGTSSPWSVDLNDTPFAFNTTCNSFTAIGCNTLALLRLYSGMTFRAGCVSTCPADGGQDQMMDGGCSGIGCCHASIPAGTKSYSTTLRNLNVNDGTTYSTTAMKDACGFAFLVENGNYSFNKKDLHRPNRDNWNLQAVLDWSIGDQKCNNAQLNKTTYACKSNFSECIDSFTGSGYICNCKKGYEGNPYLRDGCQDTDECLQANICITGSSYRDSSRGQSYANRSCVNIPGSYNCICPQGFVPVGDICLPRHKSTKLGIIIGVACGSSGIFVFIFAMARTRLLKKRVYKMRQKFFRQNQEMLLQQQQLYGHLESITDRIRFFTLKKLEKATDNFDKSRIVGDGGHGTVYKGILDLQVVAIKKSKLDIRIEAEQFINEIVLLSQINHRNVVRLIGCCLEAEVPLLVYEFISNGTLFHHLHYSTTETTLSWNDRLRIATEISSALAYMHSAANVSIFHRDMKSLNILLDDKLTVKISDFGASKSIEFDKTHISTNIQGTFGYLDPEYMQTSQLTEKSDVYSFGVILVELLMGEKPSAKSGSAAEGNMISRFIWAHKGNRLIEILECSITEDSNLSEVETVADIAMASLSIRGKNRPTMKEVELRLEGLMRNKKK